MDQARRDARLMEIALLFSRHGTCMRLQTGAVIARSGRILSSGYNGAPAGLPHCEHTNPSSVESRDACRVAVHAELNAIAFAARQGVATEFAEIVCTHMPCVACAQAIINAGIERVVYANPYRDTSGISMLMSAGLLVEQI
jgi:dCMP deaminase